MRGMEENRCDLPLEGEGEYAKRFVRRSERILRVKGNILRY